MIPYNKHRKSKTKGVLISLCSICSIIFLVVALYQLKDVFMTFLNLYVPPKATQLHVLTSDEKEEDLQYCYESLLYGHPAIQDYEEVFGISITDKYDRYKALIKSTNSNYEFFCVMNAFMREFPSFHTDLVFPENNAYVALRCFGSERINADRMTIASSLSWNETIIDSVAEYREAAFYLYEYIDGAYWSVDHGGSEDVVLIDVDGIPVDQYITSAASSFGIWYDGKHAKLCRTRIVFNDRYGDKVNIKVRDKSGTESTETVFASLYAEAAYWVSGFDQEEEQADFKIDQIGDICYIQLNNMLVPTLMDFSKAMKGNAQQKIILDLRDNYGGNERAVKHLLYPVFMADKMAVTKEWYMPSYGVNKIAYSEVFNRIVYRLSEKTDNDGSKMFVSKINKVFGGKAGNNEKKIAILISRRTGSAADEFVNVSKGQDNVLIIGNNTGGEGLMGTFATDTCPNSRLVFVYMPSRVLGDAESEYTTKGTAPDIYVSNTIEDYKESRDSVLEEAVKYLDEN